MQVIEEVSASARWLRRETWSRRLPVSRTNFSTYRVKKTNYNFKYSCWVFKNYMSFKEDIFSQKALVAIKKIMHPKLCNNFRRSKKPVSWAWCTVRCTRQWTTRAGRWCLATSSKTTRTSGPQSTGRNSWTINVFKDKLQPKPVKRLRTTVLNFFKATTPIKF